MKLLRKHPHLLTIKEHIWLNRNPRRKRKQIGLSVYRPPVKNFLIPLLAIVTALIIGALVIIFTDQTVYEAFNEGVGAGLKHAWDVVSKSL